MGLTDRAEYLLRRATLRGLRDGLIGGSRWWMAIGAVAALTRFLRRPGRKVVVTEKLEPGERLEVLHLHELAGRRRRT
ncbi:MAG: hypothetical protein ACRDYD_13845 [Acidimicrobiales bacterium]